MVKTPSFSLIFCDRVKKERAISFLLSILYGNFTESDKNSLVLTLLILGNKNNKRHHFKENCPTKY